MIERIETPIQFYARRSQESEVDFIKEIKRQYEKLLAETKDEQLKKEIIEHWKNIEVVVNSYDAL